MKVYNVVLNENDDEFQKFWNDLVKHCQRCRGHAVCRVVFGHNNIHSLITGYGLTLLGLDQDEDFKAFMDKIQLNNQAWWDYYLRPPNMNDVARNKSQYIHNI